MNRRRFFQYLLTVPAAITAAVYAPLPQRPEWVESILGSRDSEIDVKIIRSEAELIETFGEPGGPQPVRDQPLRLPLYDEKTDTCFPDDVAPRDDVIERMRELLENPERRNEFADAFTKPIRTRYVDYDAVGRSILGL